MSALETLRLAVPGEETRLKELWQICFQDDASYVNRFFDRSYTPGQALVLETGGEIVSMLLTFSQEILLPDGAEIPICYVYAFCTHPEHQGHGYGCRLLAYAEEQAAQMRTCGVVMVPGEESLFRFYQALGYEVGFSNREQVISRGVSSDALLPVTPCSLEEYQRIRSRFLQGRRWIRYPKKNAAWQECLCQSSGGGLYRVGDGIAAVDCWSGSVMVKELLAREPEPAAQALLRTLGQERALVRTSVPLEAEEGKPFGVIKWLEPQAQARWAGHRDGYLAFAFD